MGRTRIAVVSTDGVNLYEHFGGTTRFGINDLGDNLTWVEGRAAEPFSAGDPADPFDAEKFHRIAALLKAGRSVYVTRIGDMPASKLADNGIDAVFHDGSVAAVQ